MSCLCIGPHSNKQRHVSERGKPSNLYVEEKSQVHSNIKLIKTFLLMSHIANIAQVIDEQYQRNAGALNGKDAIHLILLVLNMLLSKEQLEKTKHNIMFQFWNLS